MLLSLKIEIIKKYFVLIGLSGSNIDIVNNHDEFTSQDIDTYATEIANSI